MNTPPPDTVPMNPVLNCLECGVPIPADAKGLCPKCLLKLGLASQLSPGLIETGVQPAPFLGFDPADPSRRVATEPFEFGGYRILRLLGKGGMGAVYEAEDQSSGRHVALKVLGHSLDSPDTRKRFLREGRLAASINHPNTVYVYGTEEIEGAPVITMELVPGGTLHDRVKTNGSLPVGEAVDAILQIVAGLEAAHAVGILHRDIKPSNCFIDSTGVVKVGDFGLSISTLARGDSAVTIAGSVLGTPEFSAPEQLRGEALDVRADIYSVGMTLYYLLTGQAPFRSDNLVHLLATVLDKTPASPRAIRPAIPEGLSRIVLRCLAKQAGDRFANYAELRKALLPFQSTAPTPATLGLRFAAGVIDHYSLYILNMLLSASAMGGFDALSDISILHTPRWTWTMVGLIVLNLAYYAVSEGLWGASPGKAMVGLRVGTLKGEMPGIPLAALRAVIFLLPTMVTLFGLGQGTDVSRITVWNVVAGLLPRLYPAFLVLSARRRNGFATMLDLLTSTRVTQRLAHESRETIQQTAEPVATTDGMPKLGPYYVLSSLGMAGEGELMVAYDTKLLRRVWVRKVPADAPPVAAGLRMAGRTGRLRWLHGQRAEDGSWDVYEAPSGVPLAHLLHEPQPWKAVRYWLLDLAVELDAASRSDSSPAELSLDRVWITGEGRAKLLDFPAPGGQSAAERFVEPQTFLNQVAISALEGRMASVEEARNGEAHVPVPLAARGALRGLRTVPDFSVAIAQLVPLTQRFPEITRRRRLGLIGGCVIPALLISAFSMIGAWMVEAWERKSPDVVPLRNALMMHRDMKSGKFPQGVDARAGIPALETWIAGRFGNLVRNKTEWNSPYAAGGIAPRYRTEAERIVAEHPNPTPQEMEDAQAVMRPALDAKGNPIVPGSENGTDVFPKKVAQFSVAGAFLWCAFFSMVCAVLFRGGVLMRALGIAVVRRDGADASRLRMLWRAVVAWSWLPLGVILGATLASLGSMVMAVAIPAVLTAIAIVWSAARRERSLQDLLAGTWLVPR